MGKLVDITWEPLDISVVAELADEENPELCAEFSSYLPFTVLQDHPVVSGASVYAWTPLVSTAPIRYVEPIRKAPVGRLRYSQLTGNKFTVQYGQGLEPLSQPVLGHVKPEFIDVLPKVGKAVWESTFWTKELIWVTVKRHGESASASTAPALPKHAKAQRFVEEAKKIQTTEPVDLQNIRLGRVRSTGSYGQYFTAWDFANGMLRDYIMYTIYPLFRLCDAYTLQQLASTLDAFDPNYSAYLGYSGLVTLEALANDLRSGIREVTSMDDAKSLLRGFLMYGNRLCAWSYHYFPWYHGVFYKREDYNRGFPGRWSPHAE
jgi:hypothetical protein